MNAEARRRAAAIECDLCFEHAATMKLYDGFAQICEECRALIMADAVAQAQAKFAQEDIENTVRIAVAQAVREREKELLALAAEVADEKDEEIARLRALLEDKQALIDRLNEG